MPKRHAILVANSVSYGYVGKNIPATIAKTHIRDFETHLDSLGDFAFETTSIVDQETDKAQQLIREAIKRSGKTSELLLLYYFGHAVRPPQGIDKLYLLFRDSDWLEPPSMLDFALVIDWLQHYKPPRVVVVMDCCYAGVIRNQLRLLDTYGGQYYLMASVTNKGKAEVDYSEERPIGTFTKYLLRGFVNADARVPLSTEVTFESWYSYAANQTTTHSKQMPFGVDGGVAKDIFFRQASTPSIASAVRKSIPKKSAYHKIFVLASYVSQHNFPDDESLYKYVASDEPKEFLTPVQVKPRNIEYRFIGETAFYWYVDLCRELDIFEASGPVRLSATGKVMMRQQGAAFNAGLFGAVRSAWGRFGVSVTDVEEAITARMRNNGIPTVDALYAELYVSKKLRMSKEFFRVVLDLTGYVGALRFSREHTFFLPTSVESAGTEE